MEEQKNLENEEKLRVFEEREKKRKQEEKRIQKQAKEAEIKKQQEEYQTEKSLKEQQAEISYLETHSQEIFHRVQLMSQLIELILLGDSAVINSLIEHSLLANSYDKYAKYWPELRQSMLNCKTGLRQIPKTYQTHIHGCKPNYWKSLC